MTILSRLLATEEDTLGYITYVFECIDEDNLKELGSKYIMVTRFPNWDCRKLEIGEEGFLSFKELRAGIDKWWDGQKMIPYNYNNIQFIKFIKKKKEANHEFRMLINLKKKQYEELQLTMTVMKEKLMDAIEAKNNDIKTFVWKLARKGDGTQEEIKLVDATPEQLEKFYKHCHSMLYSNDKLNPGRYVLLNIISEQREKCNTELFLRKLESGAITADGEPYPRYLYMQNLRAFLNANKSEFPTNKLGNISIAACTNGLPREFQNIPIEDVLDGCLDQLGYFDNKHITFSFILNMGIYLTPDEMKEFDEKDKNGKTRSKLELIKERLNIKPTVRLTVKPTGLNFKEFRAMVNLKPKKFSELTTDQLLTLRNKVLFRLENEVQFHIDQWEDRIRQIKLVAESKNLKLTD